MSHPFEYQRPTQPQADLMAGLNTIARDAYEYLLEVAAVSAERTLAVHKLQEFRMWANVAILGIGL